MRGFRKGGVSVRFSEGWRKCAILGRDYIKCDVSVRFFRRVTYVCDFSKGF